MRGKSAGRVRGCFPGTSRFGSNWNKSLRNSLERKLRSILAAGTWPIFGLLTAPLKKDDLVYSDALNHASLIDDMRLSDARKIIYLHLDLNTLEGELRKHAHERGRKLIVTESVFSMEGDIAPVTQILELAERYGAGVIVDEAHATGVQGPSGRGIAVRDGIAQQLAAESTLAGKRSRARARLFAEARL